MIATATTVHIAKWMMFSTNKQGCIITINMNSQWYQPVIVASCIPTMFITTYNVKKNQCDKCHKTSYKCWGWFILPQLKTFPFTAYVMTADITNRCLI